MIIRAGLLAVGLAMVFLMIPADASANDGYLVASQDGVNQKAVKRDMKRERKTAHRAEKAERKAKKGAHERESREWDPNNREGSMRPAESRKWDPNNREGSMR